MVYISVRFCYNKEWIVGSLQDYTPVFSLFLSPYKLKNNTALISSNSINLSTIQPSSEPFSTFLLLQRVFSYQSRTMEH